MPPGRAVPPPAAAGRARSAHRTENGSAMLSEAVEPGPRELAERMSVEALIETLARELKAAMAMAGRTSIAELDRSVLDI